MSLLNKIGIIAFYSVLLVIIIYITTKLAKVAIDMLSITASGVVDAIRTILYLVGIFGGVWFLLYLWDNYGKVMTY
jgi:hypothetical protein